MNLCARQREIVVLNLSQRKTELRFDVSSTRTINRVRQRDQHLKSERSVSATRHKLCLKEESGVNKPSYRGLLNLVNSAYIILLILNLACRTESPLET